MTSSSASSNLSSPLADSWCRAYGKWIRYAELSIAVNDIGFRQGVVAVERLRTYGGQPFRVADHLDRWDATTAALSIDSLPGRAELEGLLGELLERNRSLIQQLGEAGITILATPGVFGLSVPTMVIHLSAIDQANINRRREQGQPLVVTRVCQPSADSWPRWIKVRASAAGDTQARQSNADALGVLLDTDGSVTETSVANLIIVARDRIASPLPAQVLPGVTQRVVELAAQQEQLAWDHRPILPAELRGADEVLLTGTDGGLWFANAVDGHAVGNPGGGPIYHRLLRRFDEMTNQSQS